ncbi:MFS transporter [Actinomycetospora termitidis]|uniref:MFS transporter n=1 Tax=Actinomycetospora termitidis TaxID=3053470 RepID=A0ABT7MA94_9PSEU|nr:MFS transporter [Actinomycetospora sp. Odt1-22]MDL5157575.1 MFS transporter [Actinomycetospora sp. Odt1-22]
MTQDTLPPGHDDGAERTGARLGLLLGVAVLPLFVSVGAPSVTLPRVADDLGVPFGATAWVLAGWALTSAATMPLAGRWAARRGPRGLLVAGMTLVALGSVVAALAPTLTVVVVGRLIGGAGAGAATIGAFTLPGALPARARLRALGTVAAATGTSSALGTLLGGALDAWAGWRVVLAFPAIALPVLLLVGVLGRGTLRAVPEPRDPTGGRADVPGAAALTTVAAAAVVLLQTRAVGLPVSVAAVVGVAGVVAVAVVWRGVRTRPDGFVPRRVVAAPGLVVAGAAGGAVFAGYYGVLFVAPALVQQAVGGGSLVAGAVLVPAAACAVLAGRIVGPTVQRLGAWRVLGGLAGLTALGVLLVAVPVGGAGVVVTVGGTALTVVGFAGAQAVVTGLVPDLVAADDRTVAAGLLNFVVFEGGAVGPAAVGGLLAVVGTSGALGAVALLPAAAVVLVLVNRSGGPRPAAGRRRRGA